jgi:hypothetical protein
MMGDRRTLSDRSNIARGHLMAHDGLPVVACSEGQELESL